MAAAMKEDNTRYDFLMYEAQNDSSEEYYDDGDWVEQRASA